MNAALAGRLDVPGLLRVLREKRPLSGDPGLVAVAEVLRLGLIAELVVLAGGAVEHGTPEDRVISAWARWVAPILQAPTDAGWWVENTPTRVGALLDANSAEVAR